MSATTSGLALPRRRALLGAATFAAAASPLSRPFIAKAAEPVRIGLLLAKTGQIAPQTEYLAQGTFLALEERGNKIMGQPAELVWLDEPIPQGATQNMRKLVQENKVCAILGGSLSSDALAEEATAAATEDPVRLRQRGGDGDHRQELQPLYVPAEHAGAGAVAHARALCADLRQEVVLHYRVVRVRPGHPAHLARTAESRPAAPRRASTRCR